MKIYVKVPLTREDRCNFGAVQFVRKTCFNWFLSNFSLGFLHTTFPKREPTDLKKSKWCILMPCINCFIIKTIEYVLSALCPPKEKFLTNFRRFSIQIYHLKMTSEQSASSFCHNYYLGSSYAKGDGAEWDQWMRTCRPYNNLPVWPSNKKLISGSPPHAPAQENRAITCLQNVLHTFYQNDSSGKVYSK